MQRDPLQTLGLHVGIALACLRPTTVRAFAGRGRSRRRDLYLVPSIADEIVANICITLAFNRDGERVIRSRIARHLADVLLGVSDSVARDWAGVDAEARDRARKEITACIVQRLVDRYTVLIQAREVIVPAADVWCGIREDEIEGD